MLRVRAPLFCFVLLLVKMNHCTGQQPQLVLPAGHTEDIFYTGYASGGRYILTSAYDHTTKLWDVYSGRLLHTFSGLRHSPEHLINNGLTTIPDKDGRSLVALTRDGYLNKWELPSAKLVFSVKTGFSGWMRVDYSRDGKQVLLTKKGPGSREETELIDGTTGKRRTLFQSSQPGRNDHTEFSPDGKYLLRRTDSTIFLYPSSGGPRLRKKERIENLGVSYFSPDGQYLLLFPEHRSSLFRLWRIADGELLELHLSGSVEFSPDSRYILSLSEGGMRLADPATGQEIYRFPEKINPYMQGHFSADGKYIFLSRAGHMIRGTDPYDSVTLVWETESRKFLGAFRGSGWDIREVAIGGHHQYIAAVSGQTQVWELGTGNELASLEGSMIAFSPDEKTLAITNKRSVQIYSPGLDTILSTLEGHSNSLTRALFEPGDKHLLTLSNENMARTWDIETGRITGLLEEGSTILHAQYAPAGGKILLVTAAGEALIRNSNNGQRLLKLEAGHISTAAFRMDAQQLITASGDSSVCTWDAVSGTRLFRLQETYPVSDAAFSPGGKYAYYIFGRTAAGIIDFTTGKVFKIYLGEETVLRGAFSPDDRYFFLLGEKGTARLIETGSGKLVKEFSKASDVEYAVTSMGGYYYQNLWQGGFRHFSPDGKKLLFRTYLDRYMLVCDLHDLSTDTIFSPGTLVRNAAFIPGTGFVMTGSTDDTVRIWKKEKKGYRVWKKFQANGFEIAGSGKWLLLVNDVQLQFYDLPAQRMRFTTLAVGKAGFFTQIPGKPWYAASKDAARSLLFRVGDQYYPFDQFDLQLNRPDLILAAMEGPDKSLVAAYRNAWKKRVSRSGFKPEEPGSSLHVPLLEITGNEPYGETADSAVTIRFTASDALYNLDRYTVTVNEVPLGGVQGFRLKDRRKRTGVLSVTIPLTAGMNTIRLSCINEKGNESLRRTCWVAWRPTGKPPPVNTYYIGLGIDHYADSSYDLDWSEKDIHDLGQALEKKLGPGFRAHTLLGTAISIPGIRELKQELRQTTIHDKVILAYSGHGLLSRDFDYYLGTYATQFSRPEQNGLPYGELEALLDDIPARKKLLLIDACHSGEIDKEEMARMSKSADSLQQQGTKGGKPRYTGYSTLGMKNSFELMQSLFVNLGQSTGTTIISAAAGTQFALERGDLKNGVFTYSILEAMNRHPSMKISELKRIVGERVEQLTNGLQQPGSRNELIVSDWWLW